jgi:dTDP-4-dehydrorhamnose 3,5-epimerase-like enzyme
LPRAGYQEPFVKNARKRHHGATVCQTHRWRYAPSTSGFPDDRGFFAELARLGSAGIAEKMTPSSERHIQISMTLSYPGAIKAIHYHYEQTDLWAPIVGMMQVILYDLRFESTTFGAIKASKSC